MAEKGGTKINYDDTKYLENVESILFVRFFGVGIFIALILVDITLMKDYNIFLRNVNFLLYYNPFLICVVIGSRIVEKKMMETYGIDKIIYTDEVKKSILKGFIIIYALLYFSFILTLLIAFTF